MRTKRVNRYYCDFCGKGGCAAGHMKKHEKHCTLNPDRVCRMCKAMEQPQPDLSAAILMLPDPEKFKVFEDYRDFDKDVVTYRALNEAVEKVLPDLREALGNCPMCVFAALRQPGLTHSSNCGGFNFKQELQAAWAEINNRELERERHDYCPY